MLRVYKQQLPFPFFSPGRGLRVVSTHKRNHEKCKEKLQLTHCLCTYKFKFFTCIPQWQNTVCASGLAQFEICSAV